MANIFDIARESGVSRSTVSRVINNQPNVKEEKRIRVQEAIKKLNYRPSAAARALALKKTNTIGVIVKELSDIFYASLVRRIHYEADSYGYGALYCHRNSMVKSEVNYLEHLSKQVDGYIFIGEKTVSKEELEMLANSGELVITIGFDLGVENVTSITIDNYDITYRMMERLIQQGHKKIMHVTAEEKTVEFEERKRAYQDALLAHGLNYKRIEAIDYDSESSYNFAIKNSDNLVKEGVTAIFTFNDSVALGMMDGLITKGLAVPGDISMVGFDDVATRRVTTNYLPTLSTISQPQSEMAEYAVSHFIKRTGLDFKDNHEIFKCRFIERESTKVWR